MSSGEGPPRDLRAGYIDAVASAIAILNKAGVCRGDLRPKNIFWRRNEKCGIDLQIIDFEDSGFFQKPIKFHTDRRFPHSGVSRDAVIVAAEVHNEWFLTSLTNWLFDDAYGGGL